MRSLPDRRGVGTLVSAEGNLCKVALFHSIENSVVEEHHRDQLVRALIGPETRVYIAANNGWRVGRVKDFDPANHPWIEYVVRFTNGQVADLAENQLRVRVFEPHADPSEVLARGGGESQFLHDRRWQALSASVRLRGASAGLSAALSSKIELVPHQLAAAQRILSDPVLRFLLADEVGMGKTIEAGIVARQCLIDDPARTVHVLAPQSLIDQWRSELLDRCDLADLESQIHFSPHSDLTKVLPRSDLLIIDEAHNLVADRAALDRLTRLAHAAPRLLLLSATPALGDPHQLLLLLHLLDPRAYGRDDIAKLDVRLKLSRDLGRILLTLADDAPDFLFQHAIRDLATRLPDDLTVPELVREIAGGSKRLADLRQHLADTYRVHQRLIRARRRDAAVYFQPRGVLTAGRREYMREEVDEDARWSEILVGIDDWRELVRGRMDTAEGASAAPAIDLIAAIDAIGAGIRPANLVDAPQNLRAALGGEPGERTYIVVAGEVIANLCRAIARDGVTVPKILAFATRSDVTRAIAARIAEQGLGAIALTGDLPQDEARQVASRFANTDELSVLVSDRSGEEGLNFSFADAIIHLDLPFSVSRMDLDSASRKLRFPVGPDLSGR